MKVKSYSNKLQFSNTPTPLDHMFEIVVDGLEEIAIGIADMGWGSLDLFEDSTPIKSVASRLIELSSKFFQLMQTVDKVKAKFERVKTVIEKGPLMAFDTYDASRRNVNNSSKYIEEAINIASGLIHRGSPYKEAYYNMTQVTIKYVALVKRFNECVSDYRRLHNITDANFMDADISLSFFKSRFDVLNPPENDSELP